MKLKPETGKDQLEMLKGSSAYGSPSALVVLVLGGAI